MELLGFYKGPGMPAFQAMEEDKTHKTEGGMEYQIVKDGKGPALKDTDVVVFHYTIFGLDGEMLETSLVRGSVKQPKGRLAGMPFFKEALTGMTGGATWLCKVPPEMSGRPCLQARRSPR